MQKSAMREAVYIKINSPAYWLFSLEHRLQMVKMLAYHLIMEEK